jgi:hypothetical protein
MAVESQRSPEEAQRIPGQPSPDFTALHPGYTDNVGIEGQDHGGMLPLPGLGVDP